MDAGQGSIAPRAKWQGRRAGERYRGERWGARRRAQVDPRIVAELVRRHGVAEGTILDVGCGTGRLRAALAAGGARWIGLDASLEMLAGARAIDVPRSSRAGAGDAAPSECAPCLAGDVMALPFRAGSLDAVVACRLLHHFRTQDALAGAVAELVRVARRVAIVSFWDAGSWPALRRRLGWKRDEGPSGRVAWSKDVVAEVARSAGARVVEFRHVLRYLSQQTFAVLAIERGDMRSVSSAYADARSGSIGRAGVPGSIGRAGVPGSIGHAGVPSSNGAGR